MANVTIDSNTAEKLYDLYNNVVAADAHYHRCQSDNFRIHVKSVYQNEGVERAFEALKAAMDEAGKKPDASESVRNARKAVHDD